MTIANENSNYYLYTNANYWLLSPSSLNLLCLALSLKHGTQIIKGEGLKIKPYIITED